MAKANSIRQCLTEVEFKLATCEALSEVAMLIDGDVGSVGMVFHELLRSVRAELERACLACNAASGKAVAK